MADPIRAQAGTHGELYVHPSFPAQGPRWVPCPTSHMRILRHGRFRRSRHLSGTCPSVRLNCECWTYRHTAHRSSRGQSPNEGFGAYKCGYSGTVKTAVQTYLGDPSNSGSRYLLCSPNTCLDLSSLSQYEAQTP